MQRAWRRKWEKNRQSMLKRAAVPVVATGLILSVMSAVYANPTGGAITTGQGSIHVNGSEMTINQQTDKLGINWNSFNIGAGEKVKFVQPGSQSVALNRVLGSDGSKIYGTLEANGKVFLINPNGVLFAQGANVNVGGLVATTSNISDADFIRGNYNFTGGQGGSVINGGKIMASSGNVELLGSVVSNQGIIAATSVSTDGSRGTVRLVGNSVNLDAGSVVWAGSHAVLRAGASGSGAGTVTVASDVVVAPQTTIYYNPVSYNDSQTKSTVASNPYKSLLSGSNVTAYMLVNKASDLQNINGNLSGVYALNNDINLLGTAFAPIGDGIGEFSGIFNGENNKISNLTINSSAKNVGLFATTNQAVIKDLTLANVNIKGTASAQYTFVGALAGQVSNSEISGIHVSGRVAGTNDYVAGVIGAASHYSTVTNVHNYATVEAIAGYKKRHIAGVVGMNYNHSIVDSSTNHALVLNVNDWGTAGGVVGYNYNGSTVSNSNNYGEVSGGKSSESYVGGIVGSNWGDSIALGASVVNSVNEGVIKGGFDSNIGGVVGGQKNSSVLGSINKANVDATGRFIGGIVGVNYDNSLLASSINYGSITSGQNASTGGVVGHSANSIIRDSQNHGKIKIVQSVDNAIIGDHADRVGLDYSLGSVQKNTGGIVGKSVNDKISNVKNSGDITVNSASHDIGGLVGLANGTLVSGSENTGRLIAEARSNVGGAIGYAGNNTNVQFVVNQGDILGGGEGARIPSYNNVGGIVGWVDNSSVENSRNETRVHGIYARNVGGIVGNATYANIVNNTNSGLVAGFAHELDQEASTGGIVGNALKTTIRDSKNFGKVTELASDYYGKTAI